MREVSIEGLKKISAGQNGDVYISVYLFVYWGLFD